MFHMSGIGGDFAHDDLHAVATLIDELDPDAQALILISGGPPCPDYSIVAASAKGRDGHEGQKFVTFTKFLTKLESLVHPRKTCPFLENVVMQNPADIQFFTDAL
jgi:site-specific DNA-cytosine methylase